MFRLRAVQKSDEAEIVDLGNSIFGPHYMEQLFRMKIDLPKSSAIFFKTKLIGYVLLISQKDVNLEYFFEEFGATKSYICSLGVHEKWRRQRVGSLLLKATAKVVKNDIALHVNVNNQAVNLYKRNGYKIVREVPFYYGRDSAYIMVLKRGS